MVRVLDKGLFQEADFAVELFQFALHDFFHDLFGLAGFPGLSPVDLSFSRSRTSGRYFFPLDVRGAAGGNVHGNVFGKNLEIVRFGHEIRLAIDLHHHADLPAGVDVGTDLSFRGDFRPARLAAVARPFCLR